MLDFTSGLINYDSWCRGLLRGAQNNLQELLVRIPENERYDLKKTWINDLEDALLVAKGLDLQAECVVCGDRRTGALTCSDRRCIGEEYGDG